MRRSPILPALLCAALAVGCAASRSDIEGLYTGAAARNTGATPVSVVFVFRHLSQQHGFDTIPKLKFEGVKDFDNLFRDALREISNLSRYETFTELPDDVNDPKRREKLATARSSADYAVELELLEESSFKQQFLSATISLLSLSVIPMPYDWNYTIRADLKARDGTLRASYQRKATLSDWIQTFLIFVYPFHPIEGKREQIYSESLHDIFRQIESEKVLR